MQTPIWVTPPNLPFDLWHHKVFKGIKNSIRNFITTNEITKAHTKMISTRIYVMVDFRVKNLTSISLESKVGIIEEEIKYEVNNFLCSLCNQVDHIMKTCTKKIFQEKGIETKTNTSRVDHGRKVKIRATKGGKDKLVSFKTYRARRK